MSPLWLIMYGPLGLGIPTPLGGAGPDAIQMSVAGSRMQCMSVAGSRDMAMAVAGPEAMGMRK